MFHFMQFSLCLIHHAKEYHQYPDSRASQQFRDLSFLTMRMYLYVQHDESHREPCYGLGLGKPLFPYFLLPKVSAPGTNQLITISDQLINDQY
jgi:hypothetical protein